MLFNSIPYLLFILPVFFVWWAVADARRPVRVWFLLGISYLFYAASSWQFLLLLIGFTTINFLAGLRIEANTGPARKLWCGFSVTVSLTVLAAFKYADFFGQSLGAGLRLAGVDFSVPLFHLALPLGVSFYTFSSVACAVDVYRGRVAAPRSWPDYALYLAFFPKLVSGPIARPDQLLPQFGASPRFDRDRVMGGVYLILFGLFKKIMVADLLASLIVKLAYNDLMSLSLPVAWISMWAYSIQIFCDFSGYTDMAIGSARILGFDLPENFDRPYLSKNPQEFWRRWHITLSQWLRDYLYISLGGSHHGRGRTYLALFLTMLLGGLWHGSAWTFVCWGAYHGLLLAGHRWLTEGGKTKAPGEGSRLWLYASIFITFNLVSIGWIFFRSPDLPTAFGFISRLFLAPLTLEAIPKRGVLVLALGVLVHNSDWLRDFFGRVFVRMHPVLQGVSAISLIALLDLFHSVSEPFIYSQF